MFRLIRAIKFLSVVAIILAMFSVVSVTKAQTPFGGSILFIRSCIGGQLITLGAPNPGEYFYGPSTRSYLFGPPSSIGQWLLGVSAGSVSCYLGPVYYGQGPYILFHGSSAL